MVEGLGLLSFSFFFESQYDFTFFLFFFIYKFLPSLFSFSSFLPPLVAIHRSSLLLCVRVCVLGGGGGGGGGG